MWWRRAGQRNVHASANLEATVHFSRCLALLESLPENAERDTIELDIRIDLGIALAGTSVYTAREWELNTDRLLVLAERIGAADKLLPILWQQWRFVFSTCDDMDRALMLARHILAIAGSGGDEGSLVMAHRVLGMSLVGCGQVAEACHHLEHAIAHYVVDRHAGLADVFAFDQRLVAMAYLALALVQRGYIDQGRRMADQVHAETLTRDHAVTTGLVLSMRLGVHMLLRENEGLGATATDLLRLQTRHPHRGRELVAASALALLDARANGTESALAAAREGIDELRRLNWLFWVPWLQMMMLEIYLSRHRLDEARSLLDQLDDFIGSTGYALLKSELCRLRAELRQMMGETPAAIEGQFMLALDVGREQGAMLAQLRAATGLTRHFHDLGREDAPGLLEPILSWFIEATESPDVRLVECAPGGGQIERIGIDPAAGLPEDGSHDEAPIAQRRVQAAGRCRSSSAGETLHGLSQAARHLAPADPHLGRQVRGGRSGRGRAGSRPDPGVRGQDRRPGAAGRPAGAGDRAAKGGFEARTPAEKRDYLRRHRARWHLRQQGMRADGPVTLHLLRCSARCRGAEIFSSGSARSATSSSATAIGASARRCAIRAWW